MKKMRDNKGKFIKTHGMYGTRLYHIWNGFRGRCLNQNNKDYKNYGGRGIEIIEYWSLTEKNIVLLNGVK